MTRPATALSLFACFLLSACGSSAPIGFSADFATLVTEADRLSNDLAPLAATPALPGSGGATYQGVVILADDFATSTSGVVGTANLTANFNAPASITGTGSGFYQSGINASGNPTGTGTPVGGSLNFSANNIGTAFPLAVDGTVTIENRVYLVDATLNAAADNIPVRQALELLGRPDASGAVRLAISGPMVPIR